MDLFTCQGWKLELTVSPLKMLIDRRHWHPADRCNFARDSSWSRIRCRRRDERILDLLKAADLGGGGLDKLCENWYLALFCEWQCPSGSGLTPDIGWNPADSPLTAARLALAVIGDVACSVCARLCSRLLCHGRHPGLNANPAAVFMTGKWIELFLCGGCGGEGRAAVMPMGRMHDQAVYRDTPTPTLAPFRSFFSCLSIYMPLPFLRPFLRLAWSIFNETRDRTHMRHFALCGNRAPEDNGGRW